MTDHIRPIPGFASRGSNQATVGEARFQADTLKRFQQSDIVSSLDLFPTLLDYAGAAIPAGLEGRSLRPTLEDREPWTRDSVVGNMRRPRKGAPDIEDPTFIDWRNDAGSYFVRTKRWHYIWRPYFDIQELYDVELDPLEEQDVSSEHAEVTDAFRTQVEEWRLSIAQKLAPGLTASADGSDLIPADSRRRASP